MRNIVLVSTLVLSLGCLGPAGAAAGEAKYDYVGVKKCKICHKKPASGGQFTIWEKGPHAQAYATLASDKAKEAAKKLGIADAQKAPECLKCHVTAFPVMGDLANQKITLEEGVSCESCHGPGSGYYKKKTMVQLTAKEIAPASVGLTLPDAKTCVKCHNAEGNPFHKEFDFDTFYAKIAHPIPEGWTAPSSDDEGEEE